MVDQKLQDNSIQEYKKKADKALNSILIIRADVQKKLDTIAYQKILAKLQK